MDQAESLSQTRWECKFHIVFIPKCRRKKLYHQLRRQLRPVLRSLAQQRECKVEQGGLQPDHVHMLVSIPPKYSVMQVVGNIKGKSAIWLVRHYGRRNETSQEPTFGREEYFGDRNTED